MTPLPTVLQVLPRLNAGGVERGTVEITDALSKTGFRAIVASEGGSLVPSVTHAGGTHFVMPLSSKSPLTIYRNSGRLSALAKQQHVSLIHARSRAPAWAGYLACKSLKLPFVTTFHGLYNPEGFMKKEYNSVMVKGDRIIAVSQFIYDHILREYDVDPTQLRLIHRGVDLKLFNPEKVIPDRLISLTKAWRLPEESAPPIIFCPGRITRIKGHEVLLQALAKLPHRQFLCIIAGSDDGHEEYREELEAQIRDMGLEGNVRIADNTSYMNEAYALSEIVVIPSTQPEAFGRTSIEAQAMGKLVIASDHGGVRETVIANETGYLVPPADAESLSAAITYALSRDEATKSAMGDYAKQHMKKHFSLDVMKSKTLDVYRELLEKGA
jgi:glycosyltransferase involved in cell wall biosynthesis